MTAFQVPLVRCFEQTAWFNRVHDSKLVKSWLGIGKRWPRRQQLGLGRSGGEHWGGKAVVLMSGEVYAIYGRYISDIFDRYIQ
jgi:hypothetical protein